MGVSKRSLYQMRMQESIERRRFAGAAFTCYLISMEAWGKVALLRTPYCHRRLLRLMTWG